MNPGLTDTYYSVRLSAGVMSYQLAHEVDSFTIDDDATRPNQVEITVGDPFSVLGDAIREGMGVEIDLGGVTEHSLAFKGRIYGVESELPADGIPKLKVVAHDDRMRMGLRQRYRRFEGMSLSEIVRQVAERYFGTVSVELNGDPTFGDNGVRQAGQTDLEFLLYLAREFECELLLDSAENALRFVSGHIPRRQAPIATLHYRRSGACQLLSAFRSWFDVGQLRLPSALASIDGDTGEELEVFVRSLSERLEVGDDFADQNFSRFSRAEPERSAALAALVGAADAAAATLQEEIGDKSFGTGELFLSPTQRAARQRQQVNQGLLGMQAEATVEGAFNVRTASIVRVENAGIRSSGNWYVRKVRHVLERGSRRTELECER